MPTYEAWIPVIARVKTTLYLEGTPEEEGIRSQSDFIERFREEGDFDSELCHGCRDRVRLDDGGLDYEEVEASDIEITKVED